MDKFINFIKKNKNKIFITLFIFLIFFSFSSDIFAAINKHSDEISENPSTFNEIIRWLVGFMGEVTIGTVLKILSVALLGVTFILFIFIYLVWNAVGGIGFPSPDKIIFNEFSIFDPNFLNVTELSEYSGVTMAIKEAVSPLYFTFFTIAGTLMVISAMIIGIKLAITSIAVEKAQYKEVLNKWLVGIILLFSLHFLILGVFTINEKICEAASEIADGLVIEAGDNWAESLMTSGVNAVNGIKNFFGSLLGDSVKEKPNDDTLKSAFTGYTGIIGYLIIKCLGNWGTVAMIYVIILLALIGQTLNLIIHYTKRVIFIIFLVVFAPLVVAVDVIKKAI